MPLIVEYLNTASLAPIKDYQTNSVRRAHTHLSIHEKSLEAWTLNSNSVENTKVLKNLMEYQMVEYDFKYYKMNMNVDVQLLILPEGKSNILPANVVVPFHPSSVGPMGIVDAETLNAQRRYLATI